MSPASGTNDYYAVSKSAGSESGGTSKARNADKGAAKSPEATPTEDNLLERIEALRQQMFVAAENLQFETAARLRDEIRRLKEGLPPEEAEAVLPSAPKAVASGKAKRSVPPKARGKRSR
ncbi:MAG: UvrB/UvrC motif-containing protein [Polyangiaceae bacterium]